MAESFTCWNCGKQLDGIILPMSRREICSSCHADLHSCKMCVHFRDEGRGDCMEERAEWISDRERANFCDYFSPSKDAYSGQSDKSAEAKAKLAALFGDEPDTADQNNDDESQLTPAELAEKRLREMLGGSD